MDDEAHDFESEQAFEAWLQAEQDKAWAAGQTIEAAPTHAESTADQQALWRAMQTHGPIFAVLRD